MIAIPGITLQHSGGYSRQSEHALRQQHQRNGEKKLTTLINKLSVVQAVAGSVLNTLTFMCTCPMYIIPMIPCHFSTLEFSTNQVSATVSAP